MVELTDEDLQNMQYHDQSCYPVESKHKRRKTHTESDAKKNPCIICYE